MFSDLKYAFRQLAKNPGVTVVIVLTLALGIGASTAVYTVVDTVLFHPHTSDPGADRQVYLREVQLPKIPEAAVSLGSYLAWEKAKSFEYIRATGGLNLTLTGEGEPRQLSVSAVSLHYFDESGTRPALGRSFLPEEMVPGKDHVIIVSHQLWQTVLGGDPHVLGRVLQVNGKPYTIIGVMPEDLIRSPGNLGLGACIPLVISDQAIDLTIFGQQLKAGFGTRFLEVWARLKPGVTPDQARAELDVISAQLAERYPATHKGWKAWLRTGAEIRARGGLREMLWTLVAAVACVQLIACANVANLLLARATSRQREIAIRLALGAGRGRIIRGLLIESVLLSSLGGAGGIVLAHWLLETIHHYGVPGMRDLGYVEINGAALGFSVGLSVLTGILFGLTPAFLTTGFDLNDSLKQGGKGATESKARGRLRRCLVVIEVVCAVVLLGTTGGLIQGFIELARSRGYQSDRVTVGWLTLSRQKPEQITAFVDSLLAHFQGVRGVQSAAVVKPFGNHPFAIAGTPAEPVTDMPLAETYLTTPDGFQTLGVRLRRGRQFTDRDNLSAAPVVIINETFAKRYFPDTDPIGRRIDLPNNAADSWADVIGIAPDLNLFGGLGTAIPPQIWRPFAQSPTPFVMTMIRTTPDIAVPVSALKAQVYAVDKDQPVAYVGPLTEWLDYFVTGQRFAVYLLSLFSLVALLLAAVGLYAVLAYFVSQRMLEIGIRMALGAQPSDVLWLVLLYGARLVGLGLLLGLGCLFAVRRVIESMLYQVDTGDPLALGCIVLLLAVVAALACWLPARKATKVDPIIALRAE